MMDGFNRHYRLFRTESARAKHRFETADWLGQQRAQRERIEFYDLRVKECVRRLEKEFGAGSQPMEVWHQAKFHYIGLLVNHHQPELAETFSTRSPARSCTARISTTISSLCARRQHRVHRERRACGQATFRAYYPTRETLHQTLITIVENFQLRRAFAHLERDTRHVLAAVQDRLALDQVKLRANFQIQVLTSLFFRNKGAYLVGKIINGFTEVPFALPILHDHQGKLTIDAALFGEEDLQILSALPAPISWWTWKCPAPMCSFAQPHAPASRGPRSTTPWAWPSRAKRCSTATFCTTSSTPATSSALRRASRAW